jgi:very-short-patch-repair endonuclease
MLQAAPENNYLYNKDLKDKAKKLRSEMTKAEACLWKYVLQGRRMAGFQFRRQRPVLKYIADFMCKELKLIIEVDGVTHEHAETAQRDIIRHKELESVGFTVLRYSDDEVLHDINSVSRSIEGWIIEQPGLSTP